MFRYLAFSWNPMSEVQTAHARKIQAAIASNGEWQLVLASERLHVYVTGCINGINQAYLLPSGRGVVLGRLFRREGMPAVADRDLQVSTEEDARVVKSDGRSLMFEFWGRWIAFLIPQTGDPLVLRDPTGALPCFQMGVENVSIVFSWLEDVLRFLNMPPPPVNWAAVSAALVYRRLCARETALEGISQVLAGELMTMTQSSRSARLLWRAADVARAPVDAEPLRAAQMLRHTTTLCVRSWMSCYDDIVLRLSGGVDSSILLGCLVVAPPTASIVCLNYHSPGSDTDEREYARIAAAQACCRLVERHRDDDFHLDQVLAPARTPLPSSHLGRMGSDRIDAQTADAVGASAMFTGAGGDQLFFEYCCTWPAADYLQLHGLDRGFPSAVLDAARLGGVSFWHALRLAFKDRFSKREPLAGIGQSITLMQPDVIANALGQPQRFVDPGLLGASDLPIGKLCQLSMVVGPLEYYNPFAPEASPELVHPLLSQPLIELCLALPTFTLTTGGRGRALARRAFADRMPAEIANRRSKGGTEDHVAAVLRRSQRLARSLLMEGWLVRKGLLDPVRVDAALSGRPSANGASVAEIHACFAMEAWLGQVCGNVRAGNS
jgi:asparagine synthase (glutamine-hydrolysing)